MFDNTYFQIPTDIICYKNGHVRICNEFQIIDENLIFVQFIALNIYFHKYLHNFNGVSCSECCQRQFAASNHHLITVVITDAEPLIFHNKSDFVFKIK